jgi:hypothetical protein
MSHQLSANDMIFYKEDDKIMSGGFSIESLLLNKGESPMYTANGSENTNTNIIGGSVSSIFKNLAVPAGLLYQTNKEKKRQLFEYNEDGQELEGGFNNNSVLSEDIHSQLMKMVEVNDSGKTIRERKTRKHRVYTPAKEKEKEKKNNSKKV